MRWRTNDRSGTPRATRGAAERTPRHDLGRVQLNGPVRYGLIANQGQDREGLLGLARDAEAAGWDAIWVPEHMVIPEHFESQYPYSSAGLGDVAQIDLHDPLLWLAHVSAVTERIRLGTGIYLIAQRHPIAVAKTVATLDALSGGRVELGIGIGWLREEMEAVDVPWSHRGERVDEYVAAVRALWTGSPASYDGKFVSFDEVHCRPQPAQGSVPIIVGGSGEAAARRAGRLGDGWFPFNVTPDDVRGLLPVVREEAERAGRDPDAVEVMVNVRRREAADVVDAWRDAGVAQVLVTGVRPSDVGEVRAGLPAD